MSERRIFRQSAIEAYRRGSEPDVVPRLISWPLVICCWILLGILLAAGLFAWYTPIPTYVDGRGIILTNADTAGTAGGEAVAVIFLPPAQARRLIGGQAADVQIGAELVRGTVARVEEGVIGPDAARQGYGLVGAGATLISEPSTVVVIDFPQPLPAATYAGSLVMARVEVGSQRLLGLILHLGGSEVAASELD